MSNGNYRVSIVRGVYAAEWREPDGRRRRASLGTKNASEVTACVQDLDAELQAQRRPAVINVAYAWNGKRDSLGKRAAASSMDSRGKAVLPHFGDMRADLIPEAVVDDYIAKRRGAGRNDGTIVADLKQLRAALAWAVRKNLIVKAPHIHTPTTPAPRDIRLTRAQAAKFMQAIEWPHLRLFVVIALTTGARKQAILDLTWDRIDFERGLIDLRDPDRLQPSKARPTVPMNTTLRKALLEAHRGSTTEYVLEYAGRKVLSAHNGFRAAAIRSGMPWITPHVLRHSAASWMAEAGVSMDEISQFLGHSDSRITSRIYARFSKDFLRRAAGALELE